MVPERSFNGAGDGQDGASRLWCNPTDVTQLMSLEMPRWHGPCRPFLKRSNHLECSPFRLTGEDYGVRTKNCKIKRISIRSQARLSVIQDSEDGLDYVANRLKVGGIGGLNASGGHSTENSPRFHRS